MAAEDHFSEADKLAIQQFITGAEAKTSGEIRVRVEARCSGDPLKRAEACFAGMKMHETAERNGVLFYLATESKVFAVFGDKGIHEKVGASFWNEISEKMAGHFREGRFTQGLCDGISAAGKQLAHYFPVNGKNPDELTNEISFQ